MWYVRKILVLTFVISFVFFVHSTQENLVEKTVEEKLVEVYLFFLKTKKATITRMILNAIIIA